MIDRITSKIKRYPFQTGIAVGVLFCLFLFGFISLFRDHGRTLSGNSEIIREDYLRMTINEYDRNLDPDLAAWRYEHLGRKADETLKLMRADNSVSPQSLVDFASAVNRTNLIGVSDFDYEQESSGSPTNPHKGLSGVGKVLLIIIGCIVIAAAILYVVSLIKTKKKQKRRAENTQRYEEDAVNVITPNQENTSHEDIPGTLFDLDALFPQNSDNEPDDGISEFSEDDLLKDNSDNKAETDHEVISDQEENTEEILEEKTDDSEPEYVSNAVEDNASDSGSDNEEEDANISGIVSDDEHLNSKIMKDDADAESDEENVKTEYSDLEYVMTSDSSGTSQDEESESEPADAPESDNEETDASEFETAADTENEMTGEKETEQSEISDDSGKETEKPLVEIDTENEAENVDELLKIIRAGKADAESLEQKTVDVTADLNTDSVTVSEVQHEAGEFEENLQSDLSQTEIEDVEENTDTEEDDILIHYQSQYRIGNDMYDEVFSIDQGETFRGECGIGIGETLNSTEPKAVTAFELWLFDKDDIHTSTLYLMSDFSLSNEGISNRLEQRGKCDRIRKGDIYTLETETLIVEIKILELEYGNEMEEKNSYFTNVVFDVIAKQKLQGS